MKNGRAARRRGANDSGHRRDRGPELGQDGGPGRARGQDRGRGRGVWLAPIIGATLIVAMAAAASLPQATAEIFVVASLIFSLGEGVVLAFIGCIWSNRGTTSAVLAAAITAALAAPGRWQVAQARTGATAQPMDLVIDLGVSVAWGAFAGLAGATILRARLAALLPGG